MKTTKTMKKFGRHGDVIFVKINELPNGKLDKTKTLALGEATGHSHRLEGEGQVIFFDPKLHSKIQDELRIKIKNSLPLEYQKYFSPELIEIIKFLKPYVGDKIVHEEHKTLTVNDKKTRAVVIQRDYTPEGYKKVID